MPDYTQDSAEVQTAGTRRYHIRPPRNLSDLQVHMQEGQSFYRFQGQFVTVTYRPFGWLGGHGYKAPDYEIKSLGGDTLRTLTPSEFRVFTESRLLEKVESAFNTAA